MSSGYTASTSPFDIAAIQKQIDNALATLKPEDHGNVIVSAKPTGINAALIVKGPGFWKFRTSAFAEITKPLDGGKFDWSASGRIAWLYGEPAPVKAKWLSRYKGWARVLAQYNGLLVSIWKAAFLASGIDVRLIG